MFTPEQALEQARESRRRWAKAHPEKERERKVRYRKAHPDRVLAQVRRWQEAHPGHKNPEKNRAAVRRWTEQNPEKARTRWANRRARVHGAVGGHTAEEFLGLLVRTGYVCTYCSCPLSEKTATRDHIVPLSKGGSNFITNIAPACKPCNCRKGAKLKLHYP